MGDRVVRCVTEPTSDGGWIVTHEDITAQRSVERKHASLAEQEQRRMAVETAIRSFRERVEAVIGTVASSASAMRGTATKLSGSSDQASQRVGSFGRSD